MKEGFLFSDMLAHCAKAAGNRPAIVNFGIEYSFSQLQAAAELCACDLIKGGMKKGDHVALWSVNCANWLIAFFGIIQAGGVAVLANYNMSGAELAKLLAFADVKHIMFGTTHELAGDEAAVQKLARTLSINDAQVHDIRAESADYLGRVRAGELSKDLPTEDADCRRVAMIVFTSGTSGTPKAVQLSQFALISNARQARERGKGMLNDRLLLALPLFHSFGLAIAVCYLCAGCTVYIPDMLTPEALADTIIRYDVADIFSIGILYNGIMAHPLFSKEVAPHVRICIIGGGFSTPEQMKRFALAFSNACFCSGYGQTEASAFITVPCPQDPPETWAYTVGKPLCGIALEIRGVDGSVLPSGEIGEIVVRGDSLMTGYYKLPKQQQAIDDDGWLHTGDLGYVKAAGDLYLTGRIKDIIIKGGENISPAEIESAILACDGVQEACVLGVPHSVWGESIAACVVPKKGLRMDELSLRVQLASRLSAFKTPDHFFSYERFPVGNQGKTDRTALRTDVMNRLGECNA